MIPKTLIQKHRMHNETADNQLKLMGNFIEKTNELGLTYLMGLGYQEQAKLMASLGEKFSTTCIEQSGI